MNQSKEARGRGGGEQYDAALSSCFFRFTIFFFPWLRSRYNAHLSVHFHNPIFSLLLFNCVSDAFSLNRESCCRCRCSSVCARGGLCVTPSARFPPLPLGLLLSSSGGVTLYDGVRRQCSREKTPSHRNTMRRANNAGVQCEASTGWEHTCAEANNKGEGTTPDAHVMCEGLDVEEEEEKRGGWPALGKQEEKGKVGGVRACMRTGCRLGLSCELHPHAREAGELG